MLQAILSTLPDAARVTEHLVARFGPEQVWQVEQLSRHIFRAWLNNGGVVLAIVAEDGAITVRELEAV